MNLGPTELLIILLIVLLLFGVGRISRIAGELGAAIRAFREGLQGPEQPKGKGDAQGSTSDGSQDP